MPQARTRNSRAGSCDPSTELSLRVRAEQDDPSIRLDRPETKDLRHERTDLARRKVRDRDNRPTDQIVAVVPRLDRGRGPAHAVGPEIDSELVRRIARLGEVLGGNDPTDAHFDPLKVLEGDGGHGLPARETASVELTLSRTLRQAGASGRGTRCTGHRVDDADVRVLRGSSTRLGASPRSPAATYPACDRPPRRP